MGRARWLPPPKAPASFEARLRLAPQDEEFSSNNAPHPEAPARRASKDARPTPT
ncbi:hypothetical protein [Caulobacter sp.]|uniref:hypothetical protein n=1 Tax=Caulobacter sp. TaxID=78 RepID=UPI003BACCD98